MSFKEVGFFFLAAFLFVLALSIIDYSYTGFASFEIQNVNTTNGTVSSYVKISDGEGGFFAGTGELDSSDRWGHEVVNIGDLDGDGVTDFAVGAYNDENDSGGSSSEGAFYILFMYDNGSVKSNVKIADGESGFNNSDLGISDRFGIGIANIGDLDSDGVTDLAVGAPFDESQGGDSSEGALYILFMYSNGTVKNHTKISDGEGGFSPSGLQSDNLGSSIVSLGDLDDDGIQDLAVGAYQDENDSITTSDEGAVYVLFMYSNGTVKNHIRVTFGESGFSPSRMNTNAFFGYSIDTLGDLDGDGNQDLIVGAYQDENDTASSSDNEGAVYVLFMYSNGTVKSNVKISDNQGGFSPSEGLSSDDEFGTSVSTLGDLDNDGVVDIAVGAPGDENATSPVGVVYILFMYSNGTVKNYTRITSGENGFSPGSDLGFDSFGTSVANATDLDGNGVLDLVVGAPWGDGSKGSIYVLYLSATNIFPSINFESPTPDVGELVHEVHDDFMVNVSYLNADNVTVRLYNSSKSLINTTTQSSSPLILNYSSLDLNSGVYYFNATATSSTADTNSTYTKNIVYVNPRNISNGTVSSHVKISDGQGGFSPIALNDSDFFGFSVASLGDLDGDGVVDLAVGAGGDENDSGGDASEGAVYVLFMNGNGSVKSHVKISDGQGGFNPVALNSTDWFGWSLSNLGDLDGDGIVDIAVGARNDENDTGGDFTEGAVYILFLYSNGSVKSHVKISDGESGFTASLDSSDRFGTSLSNLGDLDGDGVVDLVVGAYVDENDSGGDSSEGAVYILFLYSNGSVKSHVKVTDDVGGFTASLDSGDNFGWSLANLGDLDGDGIVDLAVGAYFDENDSSGENGEGAVYILFLYSNGSVKSHVKITDGQNGFNPLALNLSDAFGSSVSNLGDLDGDGVVDLAVGARRDENDSGGDSSEGVVYVLFLYSNGSVKGHVKITDDVSEFNPEFLNDSDFFGTSLSNLGDLDGDGVVDLAVGAYQDENDSGGDNSEGAIYILSLNATGAWPGTESQEESEGGDSGGSGGSSGGSSGGGGGASVPTNGSIKKLVYRNSTISIGLFNIRVRDIIAQGIIFEFPDGSIVNLAQGQSSIYDLDNDGVYDVNLTTGQLFVREGALPVAFVEYENISIQKENSTMDNNTKDNNDVLDSGELSTPEDGLDAGFITKRNLFIIGGVTAFLFIVGSIWYFFVHKGSLMNKPMKRKKK